MLTILQTLSSQDLTLGQKTSHDTNIKLLVLALEHGLSIQRMILMLTKCFHWSRFAA